MKQLVYDVGMYDGSDTAYYLSEGYKVVAIEAHPGLIEKAQERFAKEIDLGQLSLVPIGVAEKHGTFPLTIPADDLGSSTLQPSHLGNRKVARTIDVPCGPISEIFEKYGMPWYLKVDIEGKDRLPVLALTKTNKPEYLSFEVGHDFAELLDHAQSIGYTKFKLINQCSFREIHEDNSLSERACRRAMHFFGYSEPMFALRGGRKFLLRHSAGPGPWASSGKWRSAKAVLERYNQVLARGGDRPWYDLHAS